MTESELNNLAKSLLDDIKNYCDVTWTDSATDNKIAKTIEDGILFLNEIADKENDFTVNGKALKLLKNYCRYEYFNKGDQFKEIYREDLMNFVLPLAAAEVIANETES